MKTAAPLPTTTAIVRHDPDATEIGKLYAAGRTSLVESVRNLHEAGCRLKAKKDSLAHGEWLPWLKANQAVLGFDGQRTAHRLMKLARSNQTLTTDISAPEALAISREVWDNNYYRAQGTGENEWYTPLKYIEAARATMGGIDLDPASCEQAQEVVKATQFYAIADDGLAQEWAGRVWLNPPYSKSHINHFIDKLIAELAKGTVTQAILLTHNHTDTVWFHAAQEHASAICFTRGRVKFVDPEGNECAPTQGQAFFYYGPNGSAFRTHFSDFGFIVHGSHKQYAQLAIAGDGVAA